LSLDAGADEFMPKPLRGRELLRILQRLAGRAAPA
jgi:DNA-binding response OmpR family regulator